MDSQNVTRLVYCSPPFPRGTMEVDSRMGTAVKDVRYRLLGPMEVSVDA